MKNILLVFAVLFCLDIVAQSERDNKKTKKAVFILIDGIALDMYHKAYTPNLDDISKTGSFSEAYVGGQKDHISESPTISAVGYNSLLTGVWAHKHNVFGNAIKNPNYNYPTIFKLLKDSDSSKKIAIFSTWQDNRTKLIGEGLEQTNFIKMDYSFDGLELDKQKFPHDPLKKYLKRIDLEVATKAANYLYTHGPDLTWVYLEHSDDVGHMLGDSQELYKTISYEDFLVGIIWEAVELRSQKNAEDWLFIITTDHGRSPEDGKHHGNQSNRERNIWVSLNKPVDNRYFTNNAIAITDIMPSIAHFLDIKIPQNTLYELDGVNFFDQADAVNFQGTCINREFLHLKWQAENDIITKAKILISYTNEFKNGGEDSYKILGSVDIEQKEAQFKIFPPENCQYAKVVLQTKKHSINTWIKLNKN